MSVEGTGCFPNLRRPRVVWVGLKQGAKEMIALHDALEKPLLELGCYRREAREYTPHITLGRIKTDIPMTQLAAALTKHQTWKAGEAVVSEVHVMSSELKPTGRSMRCSAGANCTGIAENEIPLPYLQDLENNDARSSADQHVGSLRSLRLRPPGSP